MLVDRFGRRHEALRISVTDRCNIRCFYCMPAEGVQFLPRERVLTYEEIAKLSEVFVSMGVHKIRLTGGEPLVRRDLPVLIRQLKSIDGVTDLALTTNGLLLADQAESLFSAGLSRLNVSLDSLRADVFQQIARYDGLSKVLSGIEAAQRAGFTGIRINAVSIRGLTESDVLPLAEFCKERGLALRFIEYMPLDADQHWTNSQVLSGRQVLSILESRMGPLIPLPRTDPSQPAVDYEYADGAGVVGFINSVSEPFCGDCNRLRLTADGQLRNCLFSTVEWNLKDALRSGASDEQLRSLIREAVAAKAAGHGINDPRFIRPERAMYQIGG
ncbi:MAG TPA: GTP 3',8-cyclase MoaA [Pirellulaceae bacterium]|nr:GTP 3',8-cyclase MoaA [Pirellulaceae bacterium]